MRPLSTACWAHVEACVVSGQLWDYEVVEAFFMGTGQQYLEVEVCPHGQHLVLALRGARGILTDKLELTFEATILKGQLQMHLRMLQNPALTAPSSRSHPTEACAHLHVPCTSRVYAPQCNSTEKNKIPVKRLTAHSTLATLASLRWEVDRFCDDSAGVPACRVEQIQRLRDPW